LKLGSIPIVCDGDKLNVASTEVSGVRVTKLHVFFDRSVIEVFINEGRRTVTKVVYPETNTYNWKPSPTPGRRCGDGVQCVEVETDLVTQ